MAYNIAKIEIWNFSEIDILYDLAICVGIRNIADITHVYLSKRRNDEDILALIESRENKSVYKRLGYLIDEFHIDADSLMDKCARKISNDFTLLDPTVEDKGCYYTKWNLRINVQVDK